MRGWIALSAAAVALAVAATAPGQAQWRDPYPYFCSISAGPYGQARPIAVTEVATTINSVDHVTDGLNSYLWDAKKGRISVPFDTSQDLHAYCVSGNDTVRNNYMRSYGSLITLKSPLDHRGWWRRPKTGGMSVVPPAPKARPKPAPPTTVAAKPVTTPLPAPTPKGPTPNQLKYQRELAEHQARLAEIERIKAETAAKHAANRGAADAELARHAREKAEHDRVKAAADAAKRQYQADLAAHQRLVDQRQTKQDRERKVDWREAVVVCNLNASDGQSKFGNWRCDGPLQMTYAKLGGTGGLTRPVLVNLSDACGGKPESVRDLGMVGASRIFGCSFGLHPQATSGFHLDAARKHGISFVPGRAIYRCPAYVSYCRTQ